MKDLEIQIQLQKDREKDDSPVSGEKIINSCREESRISLLLYFRQTEPRLGSFVHFSQEN
jgi:hypothetical protein